MKVRASHTDPLESIGLGSEHGAEQSGEQVGRSDVQPQPRRDPPPSLLPLARRGVPELRKEQTEGQRRPPWALYSSRVRKGSNSL